MLILFSSIIWLGGCTALIVIHQQLRTETLKAISIAKRFMESIILESRLEDINWLNAELADWPPYDWGPEGVPKGKPVRFVEGKGLEIEGSQKNRVPVSNQEM